MKWSRQQEGALKAINYWLKNSSEQVFRLFGTAGTGKTEIANQVKKDAEGAVYCVTPTGKAASVLRKRGWTDATTVHSLLYTPATKSKKHYLDLHEALEAALKELQADPSSKQINDHLEDIKDQIRKEKANLSRPAFSKNSLSPLYQANLCVLDEGSMVDDFMGSDLISTGCKILVLGDPAQLPPIKGDGFFFRDEPNIMLTDIRRQALDSPIIALAEKIRNQERPAVGHYGEGVEVINRNKLDPDQVAAFVREGGQLLLGKNESRIATNFRVRELHGRSSWVPEAGERIVCLGNNHPLGLLNGDQWDVVNSEIVDDEPGRMALEINQEGSDSITVDAHTHYFQGCGKDLQWWEKRDAEQFDFGYALTVHKAQGSQWSSVYMFDQSATFGKDWWRWLYTGTTRAEKGLKIIYS